MTFTDFGEDQYVAEEVLPRLSVFPEKTDLSPVIAALSREVDAQEGLPGMNHVKRRNVLSEGFTTRFESHDLAAFVKSLVR